jgi:hypothetical protein
MLCFLSFLFFLCSTLLLVVDALKNDCRCFFDVGSGNGDDKSDVHPRDPAARLVYATAADHTRLCKYRSEDCLLGQKSADCLVRRKRLGYGREKDEGRKSREVGQLYVVVYGGCGEVSKARDPRVPARLRNSTRAGGAAFSSASADRSAPHNNILLSYIVMNSKVVLVVLLGLEQAMNDAQFSCLCLLTKPVAPPPSSNITAKYSMRMILGS